ncbi:MAG: class I SAM-dependent methyltransferase [Anaerolineae bacterium]
MDERSRIRAEYERRAGDARLQARYSRFNTAHLFLTQSRERDLLRTLKRHNLHDLSEYAILDVGCGAGDGLLSLAGYGAQPRQTFGLDLMPDRLRRARSLHPGFGLAQADGGALPFPPARFDLVLQFTLFTSILDEGFKGRIAGEMLRVLKPGGAIIWYDFWADNPRNPEVKGIKPAEIKALFPGCACHLRRTTLAPPLARRLVPRSWLLAEFLAHIPWVLTHYLAVIQKK